jgi:hypothetical protein
MRGLRLLRSRAVYLLAVLALLAMPAVASAAKGFTEQVASARWLIPFQWLRTVSVDASWTGTGPIETTVNGSGSMRKQRSATATARIVFDGNTLVTAPPTSHSLRRLSESLGRSSASSAGSSERAWRASLAADSRAAQ